MTLRNDYSPVTGDLYLALGTPGDPLKNIISSGGPLISDLYMPHALELKDVPVVRLIFPTSLRSSVILEFLGDIGMGNATRELRLPLSISSTFVCTMMLVSAGGDVTDPANWLSSDCVEFVYEG